MITETKEIYKCGHCKKLYQRAGACEKHELACKKRPDYLRPCHSCKVLKMVRTIINSGYGDDDGERTVEVLFCEKRDCFIHPPSVAAKGNKFEMGDKSNEEMPKQCEFYVQINKVALVGRDCC